MFVSVDGKAKEVAEIFAGGTDGKAHKITELFGSVDGVAKQLFSDTPKATNNFDKYSWEEIKQFANDGLLLEHFNLYDRVTIKLKTPLENELNIYLTGHGIYKKVPLKQYEMVFQIVELTETKMRLMCPRVNVLGYADSTIYVNQSRYGSVPSQWAYYVIDFENGTGDASYARHYIGNAWGMTEMYSALKTIQNSLPDDLVNVLSVCATPMTEYTRHPITDSLIMEFDEDMKVRQVTTNEFLSGADTSNYDIVYPIITKSYYPETINEYLCHIQLPLEYDTYEQRRYMVKQYFAGLKFLDHDYAYSTNTTSYYTQSWCDAPYASCYYRKGMTTNDEYEDYMASGRVYNGTGVPTGFLNTIFPEIIIEKS